jgi:hypothetical protein
LLQQTKIILPRSLTATPLKFWNQLFFWVTVIISVKAWLEHRKQLTKHKVKISVNGKEYYAKHITVKDGHMFLDGRYIGPEDVDHITVEEID